MKKITTALFVIMSLSATAQPFLGLGLNNRGGSIQLGILAQGIEITAAYKTPFSRTDVPSVASLSIGKQILLSNKEDDNYSITPAIGFASYRMKDFTKYDQGSDEIIQVSEFKPIYGIEVGKDSYMGRVFISASYCKSAWFGIGVKVFTNRN